MKGAPAGAAVLADAATPPAPKDLVVLIAALDCERTIAEVVAGARAACSTVVVVSDGSRDQTSELAEQAGAEVLVHAENLGKGAALQTGMRHLAQRGLRRVLTMDGDGQHLAAEIARLIAASEAAPEALVIGARRVAEGEVSSIRLFGNRFANRWVEIACGLVAPDTQSGFRIYPLRATLALEASASHFAWETEVLIRAVRAGIRIASVPVRAYYPPPDTRVSHYRPVVDTVRIIRVVLGLIAAHKLAGLARARRTQEPA